MSSNDRDDSYLWDRTGERDSEIDKLTAALAPLRAPAAYPLRPRRRWLTPAILGAVAAVAMIALVKPNRLPTQVVGLVSGERGASAVMIEGGTRLELDVVTSGDQRDASVRLVKGFEERVFEDFGVKQFHVRYASPERLIVELPGDDRGFIAEMLLEREGLWRPFSLAVTSASELGDEDAKLGEVRVKNLDITAARYDMATDELSVELTDEAAARLAAELSKGGSVALVDGAVRGGRTLEREKVAALGTLDGHTATLAGDIFKVKEVVRALARGPGDLLVDIASIQVVGPTLSTAQAWIARGLFALFVGLLVFAIAGVAARRMSPLDPLVDPDRRSRRRRGIFAATSLAAVAIGLGLASTRGPFVGAAATILQGPWAEGTTIGVGFAIFAAGFLLALAASVAVRPWRRDLICDPGRRFLLRGELMAVSVAVALGIAAAFDAHSNVLIAPASPGDAIDYLVRAMLLASVIWLIGARALGGSWLCLTGACAAIACLLLAASLSLEQRYGLDGIWIAAAVVLMAAVAALTAVLLSRPTGETTARVRAPLGGIAPLIIAVVIAEVLDYTHVLADDHAPLTTAAIAVPLALLLGWLARSRFSLGSARVARGEADRRAVASAVALTGLWLGALIAADAVAIPRLGRSIAILAAVATAVVMDLVAELRARRRRPGLAAAWNLHHPQLVGLVERALDGQAVDVFMRARYLRSCLGILGVFVPITVMVDRDRVDEARGLIASTLGCSSD